MIKLIRRLFRRPDPDPASSAASTPQPYPKTISRDALPESHSPDDDGFDAYRLAMAMECLEVDGVISGYVDEQGNLVIDPPDPIPDPGAAP